MAELIDNRGTVIHNGLKEADMCMPDQYQPSEAGGDYILCIANCNERKGLDLLIAAFAVSETAARQQSCFSLATGPFSLN